MNNNKKGDDDGGASFLGFLRSKFGPVEREASWLDGLREKYTPNEQGENLSILTSPSTSEEATALSDSERIIFEKTQMSPAKHPAIVSGIGAA